MKNAEKHFFQANQHDSSQTTIIIMVGIRRFRIKPPIYVNPPKLNNVFLYGCDHDTKHI